MGTMNVDTSVPQCLEPGFHHSLSYSQIFPASDNCAGDDEVSLVFVGVNSTQSDLDSQITNPALGLEFDANADQSISAGRYIHVYAKLIDPCGNSRNVKRTLYIPVSMNMIMDPRVYAGDCLNPFFS